MPGKRSRRPQRWIRSLRPQNYYNLGVIFINSGKTDEAADAFKQSIAADANFGESYYQLGMALSATQATIPAAIEALNKYIAIGRKPEQVEVAKQIVQALGGKIGGKVELKPLSLERQRLCRKFKRAALLNLYRGFKAQPVFISEALSRIPG